MRINKQGTCMINSSWHKDCWSGREAGGRSVRWADCAARRRGRRWSGWISAARGETKGIQLEDRLNKAYRGGARQAVTQEGGRVVEGDAKK